MSETRPVAVLGECVADAFVVPGGTDDAGLRLDVLPGGGPANTAVALARLGTATHFLGRFSGDVFGRMFRRRLAGAGVRLDLAPDAAEPSTLAVAGLGADGRAEYSFHAEATADWQWTGAELAPVAGLGAACLHTGSLALVREPGAGAVEALLERLRPDTTVSLDPNVRPLLVAPAEYRARLPRWCALADILRLSEDDLAHLHPGLSPEQACDDWHRAGVPLVVVTLGGAGALVSYDGVRTRVPAPAVDVVDTVGAGDAFTAGLLHRLHLAGVLGGRPAALTSTVLHDAVAFGTRVAAATCAVRGANPPTAAALAAEAV
ncbi:MULTISPECIES: carbohydrate kinase family protein [Streptomyces]|uniref:Carbohydrate kinase n=1 Tax=Streptomyces solicathayae TaxID=3081768 RepID=A0ABZ0LPG1_9ACTN|nr:carbohydrate kinase [Streptomyces sp. HUAS YS2]WOX21385.1 carbohydrate kinase [Streptomyces sp. HUAS YS2]